MGTDREAGRLEGWRSKAGTVFETEKQPVVGSRGAVATNNPIGSAAGLEMLALGGNAIDAAIAALFALNVVEPQMVGVFGAGWMNIRLPDGTAIVLDNYAQAPAAAGPDLFRPISDTWPDYMQTEGHANRVGYLAAGVPGALKGWAEAIESWGRLDLETVLQPAIRHAERGFRPSRYLLDMIVNAREQFARFPGTASVFLPGGEPPAEGDLLVQGDLAESLRVLARDGPDAIYGGSLGQVIADDVAKNGGLITLEDLRSYRTFPRDPLVGTYRGYELTVPPPPSAGGLHILQILGLLEGFDLAALGFGTADAVHLLAECFKIAFADRSEHLGDPAQTVVPVDWLLSADYAGERRAQIALDRATSPDPGIPPSVESASTTHVTAADAEGHIACMTQTINEGFGAKVIVPGTGIFLNNTMALFDPHPGHANSVGPCLRMISSMSPTILCRDGRPYVALGTPGGVRIFPSVAQAIVNIVDHGMTLQEAVEAPRVWTQGQELEVESTVPESMRQELAGRGHTVKEVRAVAGGMNGVMFDQDTNTLTGAACWRADGGPSALSGGSARPGTRFRPTVERGGS
ncbi:MAG: gamma-glutamyltransferase [Candidatus Latescibacteria bacterium]|jgi:gamma-glutamyltranspeptidase/glutathione hydrolase|nr:gamma-glutamyltransferase [Candidatus Latescibacterota bacterium]